VNNAADEQATRGRGRGTSTRKKRPSAASCSRTAEDNTGGRGRARRSYNRVRGSAQYWLFGDDEHQASQPIPDLNAPADEEEVQITQNAPADDVLDHGYHNKCILLLFSELIVLLV
jgi:hypothetical protein